jgi:hypothetical protein
MEKISVEIILTFTISFCLISCSNEHSSFNCNTRSNKLCPERSYEDMGFGCSISANENYLVATSYDKEIYLFKKADDIWEEDPTRINAGYTLNTAMSNKYIAISYLSSSAKTIIKVLQIMDRSLKEDLLLENTESDYEELNGNISISNRHLILGFSPTCPAVSDISGILIYTKENNEWKRTGKIELDSCKDFDLNPVAVTNNFAFLTYEAKNNLKFVRVLNFKNSKWEHKCDIGTFGYVDLIDANERYLVVVSSEGDIIKVKPKIFIYELYNDSIGMDPIIIRDFNNEIQSLKIYNDKLLISEMEAPYFFDNNGTKSNVMLYQIKGKECLKIAQFLSGSKDIRRLMFKGDWNCDRFGFSIGLNSENVFIGSPKDEIQKRNQGSVSVLRY